jgi:hypothetical protein
MTANTDTKFEDHLAAARLRLKPRDSDEDTKVREYFAVLYQYAPTLAATPIVAASWLKNVLQTTYLGPSEIYGLARTEAEIRLVNVRERKRLLDAWHTLMRDPSDVASLAIRKVDPEEHALRVRARNAVMEWLEVRPELTNC